MALASVLMARYAAFGLLPAAVGALVVALACGVFNGLTITVGRVQPLIATLAMMGIARGLAFSVTEKSLLVANPIIGQIGRFGGFISVPTLVWGILAVAAATWCRVTRQGTHAYAIGGNETTARLAGVRVNRIRLGTYATSGLLSGIAGLVLVIRSNSGVPLGGVGWELDSIASIVIGGTSLFGG